jgi:hypothetical protein
MIELNEISKDKLSDALKAAITKALAAKTQSDKNKYAHHMKAIAGGLEMRRSSAISEGLQGSLSSSDYTPGQTLKHTNTNCKTCHGRKNLYKMPDGTTFADNKKGSSKIKCTSCGGTGYMKEEVDCRVCGQTPCNCTHIEEGWGADSANDEFKKNMAAKEVHRAKIIADHGEGSPEHTIYNNLVDKNGWKGNYAADEAKKRAAAQRAKGKVNESLADDIANKALAKRLEKMSQEEKVKGGWAHPDTLKKKDMTGNKCTRCGKGTYAERSQHDDMQGTVSCSCGHSTSRWK